MQTKVQKIPQSRFAIIRSMPFTRSLTLPDGKPITGTNGVSMRGQVEEIYDAGYYGLHGITYADGDVIVDAGANIGIVARWVYGRCRPGRYVAAEPVEDLCRHFRHNTRDLTPAPALHRVALGDREGEVRFLYYPHQPSSSLVASSHGVMSGITGRSQFRELIAMSRRPGKIFPYLPRVLQELAITLVRWYFLRRRTIRCRMTTLSSLLRSEGLERVDLLKIDAESSEEPILAGIAEQDWPKIRQMIIEVHTGRESGDRMTALLSSRGFSCVIDSVRHLHGIYLIYARRTAD